MRRQPKLVDYDGLRENIENNTEYPELLKRLLIEKNTKTL